MKRDKSYITRRMLSVKLDELRSREKKKLLINCMRNNKYIKGIISTKMIAYREK